MSPTLEQYIGIDYSGAQTPSSSLSGLPFTSPNASTLHGKFRHHRVPASIGRAEESPNGWSRGSPKNYRRSSASTTVFHSRFQYFEKHGLLLDWSSFLDDFQQHWPTDEDIYVDFVRDGSSGNGAARSGNSRWRRVTELRARTAKSVFQFDVQGAVAKSTHAGIPWLRYIRQRCQKPRSFLAIRRLERSDRSLGHR